MKGEHGGFPNSLSLNIFVRNFTIKGRHDDSSSSRTHPRNRFSLCCSPYNPPLLGGRHGTPRPFTSPCGSSASLGTALQTAYWKPFILQSQQQLHTPKDWPIWDLRKHPSLFQACPGHARILPGRSILFPEALCPCEMLSGRVKCLCNRMSGCAGTEACQQSQERKHVS